MKYLVFLILVMCLSCEAQSDRDSDTGTIETEQVTPPFVDNALSDPPIADYVVEIFADSKDNLWFGTMSRGR